MADDDACRPPSIGIADATYLLALFLWDEAAGESVRVREALAAAIANQVRLWQARAAGAAEPGRSSEHAEAARALLMVACLDRCGRRDVAPPPAEEPIFACCQRIARRAVNGALRDPTGGAVRFHRLGVTPPWAESLQPGPLIGSHLFYGEPDPAAEADRLRRFLR
ncbi:MAG TPA: cell wall hydrolase [Rhodospirillales bacterium]|nr:cell wall hydrolase [Rhodospirillales bacterium]